MTKATQTVHEPLLRIAKRDGIPFGKKVLIRAVAILLALVVDALFIFFVTGLNPLSVYGVMYQGTFATPVRFSWALRDLATLLCVGIALAPAFKMRFWNIGAEGQICVGAIAGSFFAYTFGASWPSEVLIPVMLVSGAVMGGLWGAIPAWFKTRFGTNETLFTLMMNYVAQYFIQFLREGPWRDPTAMGFPIMPRFEKAARLPKLLGIHMGWVVALALVALVFFYLRYTKHGYELTVVGENENTARYAGMPVKRIILRTMFLSAAICGLAGVMQASGADMQLTDSVAGGVGFTAIIVAWLARLSPLGILLTSVLFGVMEKGSGTIESAFKISPSMADVLQGIILFFVLGAEFFINYRLMFRRHAEKGGVKA